MASCSLEVQAQFGLKKILAHNLEVIMTMRVLEFEKAGQKASNTLTRRFIDSGFSLFGIQGQRQMEPGGAVMRPNIS